MQSTVQFKKWGDLTGEEETQKLLKLNDLLKKHGLERTEALSTDHLCYMLKSNFSSKQSKLMVTGKVSAKLALNARQFTAEAKEALGDINPYTYLVSIDVQPIAIDS